MSMRCLLVGSTGRIGSFMMRHWSVTPAAGLTVVPQARSLVDESVLVWSPRSGDPLPAGRFDAMLMLAGVTPSGGGRLSANAEIAEASLAAAAKARIGRVLVASSASVYGAGSEVPFRETDALRPASDYGRSKVEMEGVCMGWRERGLDVTCLRIGNVAGADALLGATHEGTVTLDQFADGAGPVRSYIGLKTLAELTGSLLTLTGQLPPVLNVAAPSPTSMEALAVAAGLEVRWRQAPSSAVQFALLDCSLVASIFDFPAGSSDPSTMVSQIPGGVAA